MIQNDSEKTVLKLETLTKQYDIILKQYQQNIEEYLSFLNEKNNTNTFVSVKRQAYWGTKPLSVEQSQTIGKCKMLCSTTKNCTGATYDENTLKCFLRTGESETTPSSNSYNAIVSENIFYLTTLKKLNNELTDINNKIIEYTSEGYKLYNTIDNNKDIQKKKLNQNYYKLAEEREIINKKMQEFQTIDQGINYSNSKINENYYSYLLLILLVIIFIIILIKYSVSKKLNS
jgi:hypothetical protein